MKTTRILEVRFERQPHREAVQRIREALRKVRQSGEKDEERQREFSYQEEENADLSSAVCPSIHPATGARSDD